VSHAERTTALQGEREDERDAEGEEATPERAQRPMHRREGHGESLVASSEGVNTGGVVQERPRWSLRLRPLHRERRHPEQSGTPVRLATAWRKPSMAMPRTKSAGLAS